MFSLILTSLSCDFSDSSMNNLNWRLAWSRENSIYRFICSSDGLLSMNCIIISDEFCIRSEILFLVEPSWFERMF